MRIAVISDIHGNIDALDAVFDDIARQGVDATANLGDSLSGPFDAHATAERLMARDDLTISGNHDRALWDRPRDEMGQWEDWVADDLTPGQIDWLRALPKTAEMGGVFFCHATPDSDEENWLDYRSPLQRLVARDLSGVLSRMSDISATVLCCGHTHAPRIVRLPTGQLIVNPGSVGCPAYFDTRFEPHFIQETGAPDARYAILEERNGVWSAALRAVPYDSRRMARMARDRGAESWAQAVETGWITPPA